MCGPNLLIATQLGAHYLQIHGAVWLGVMWLLFGAFIRQNCPYLDSVTLIMWRWRAVSVPYLTWCFFHCEKDSLKFNTITNFKLHCYFAMCKSQCDSSWLTCPHSKIWSRLSWSWVELPGAPSPRLKQGTKLYMCVCAHGWSVMSQNARVNYTPA